MKNLGLFLGSAAVIGIGVAGYLLLGGQPEADVTVSGQDSAEVETVTQNEREPFFGTNSLSYLLGLAEDLECTIEFTDELSSSTVRGTYFTSLGRLRGDFEVPSPAGTVVSSMILRDEMLYSWTTIGGESYGMQIDLATRAKTVADEAAPDTNEPVPLEAPVTYSCKSWTAKDDSIFELPRDVIFKDYADLMGQGMEDGTVYEEGIDLSAGSPCALCDQVAPGQGQDECKARFQCQ